MKICIISCGPGLSEIVSEYGHSSDWIPLLINDSSIQFSIKKIYENEILSIDDADAWIITGSKYSVYDNVPWISKLEEFIKLLNNHNKSILGICFGHQLLAQSLGGKVIKNVKGWELGSYKISLTKKGQDNPLFISFSDSEIVYESHQDVVTHLPDSAVELAYSLKGNQSFQYNDNIFGVQFHPEFSLEITRKLMNLRIDKGIVVDNTNLEVSTKGSKILLNYIKILKKRNN